MRKILMLAIGLMLAGCSGPHGFDRGALQAQLQQTQSKNQNIKDVLALRPQLPRPCKIAVYFRDATSHWLWQWQAADKEVLLRVGPELKRRNLVSDLFLLGDNLVEGGNLVDIRLAAARLGADAVLVVDGVNSTDQYGNLLSPLYVALLPMLFVPGTELDALFMARAALWDVRNEYLYLYGEGEGLANQTRPLWFIQDKHVIAVAKTKALEALQKSLLERVAVLTAP